MSTGTAALVVGLANVVGIIIVGWWSRTTKNEVQPNGGSSLRDSVNRIEGTVSFINERVDGLNERIDEVADEGSRTARRVDAAHRRMDRFHGEKPNVT